MSNQVIADLEEGTLEMAPGPGLLHQLGRAAKVGVHAGLDHQGIHFPLADDGA